MEPLTREEAFVGIALCAAYADGSMGAEEDEELREQLRSCHALADLDEDDLSAAMTKADALSRKHGDSAFLLHAARSVPLDMRGTAFYLGAELVVADGEFAREEHAFIERLRRALELDDKVAEQILDVVSLRDRA